MANNVKILKQFTKTGSWSIFVDLFEVTSPKSALVTGIMLASADAATPTVTLKAVTDTATEALFYKGKLEAVGTAAAPGRPVSLEDVLTLGPGEKLQISSDLAAASVTAVVMGVERD